MEEKRDYKIYLWQDEDAGVWLAECPELCMAIEGTSLSKLINRSYIVAEEMVELNNMPPIAHLHFLGKEIVGKKDNLDDLKLKIKELYPCIERQVISHGHAAEILGISKTDFLEICDSMGYPYLDAAIPEDLKMAKWFVEHTNSSSWLRPRVVKAYPQDEYFLELHFDNGEIKRFDVKPYIQGDWYSGLSDQNYFNKVTVDGFTVVWPDGQDLCPDDLYYLSIKV